MNGHLPVVQWLLKEGGSSITETNRTGEDVWKLLRWPSNSAFYDDELAPSTLFKIMLLCGEPPEMTEEDKTDSRLTLIARAEMLRAALPGWRRRRTEMLRAALPG